MEGRDTLGLGVSSLPPHPSPSNRLSVEFVNAGGWLSHGDLAFESRANFLAVAEHRFIPARARAISSELRRGQLPSVWHLRVRTLLLGVMLVLGWSVFSGPT